MNDAALIELAIAARSGAYAPYSSFKVGAAILNGNGEIALGCNIENISFGLTMCAERVAVGSAVQQGWTKFVTIAIVTDSKEPVVPCGACRQVLAEFNPALRIVSSNLTGESTEFSLATLFPHPNQGILG